ncbi:MAG TPA: dimethyl sulfoxide reductase anchor subunit [Dokdonella sp.]|nr:dimethyl sulfoxide reductase anchor subunit [Dokdonella sp.]
MRPTFSIVFFTVMSGAGYGLWILAALASLLHGSPLAAAGDPGAGLLSWMLAAGFVLVSSGLVSSLGHLGQPRRAWRAFSQWRSSWLSREGIAAVLTFLPVAAIAAALFHDGRLAAGDPGAWFQRHAPVLVAANLLLLAGSLATLFCTANIYACLKPVRAWHNRHVVVGYLLLGTYSGSLWAWALTAALPASPGSLQRILLLALVLGSAAGALLKVLYWRFIGRQTPATTGDAIGLASLGTVRSFEHPHTEENYLTHEMGFRLARKHSRKLRRIALFAAFLVPAMLSLVALSVAVSGWMAWFALVVGMAGIFVERWLFFAEAKHAVMLYYGSRSA